MNIGLMGDVVATGRTIASRSYVRSRSGRKLVSHAKTNTGYLFSGSKCRSHRLFTSLYKSLSLSKGKSV